MSRVFTTRMENKPTIKIVLFAFLEYRDCRKKRSYGSKDGGTAIVVLLEPLIVNEQLRFRRLLLLIVGEKVGEKFNPRCVKFLYVYRIFQRLSFPVDSILSYFASRRYRSCLAFNVSTFQKDTIPIFSIQQRDIESNPFEVYVFNTLIILYATLIEMLII